MSDKSAACNISTHIYEMSREPGSSAFTYYDEQGEAPIDISKIPEVEEEMREPQHYRLRADEGLLTILRFEPSPRAPDIITLLKRLSVEKGKIGVNVDDVEKTGRRIAISANIITLKANRQLAREEKAPDYYFNYLRGGRKDMSSPFVPRTDFAAENYRFLQKRGIENRTLEAIMALLNNGKSIAINANQGELALVRAAVSMAFATLPNAHNYIKYKEVFGDETSYYSVKIVYGDDETKEEFPISATITLTDKKLKSPLYEKVSQHLSAGLYEKILKLLEGDFFITYDTSELITNSELPKFKTRLRKLGADLPWQLVNALGNEEKAASALGLFLDTYCLRSFEPAHPCNKESNKKRKYLYDLFAGSEGPVAYLPELCYLPGIDKIRNTIIHIMNSLETNQNTQIRVPIGKRNLARALVLLFYDALPNMYKWENYEEKLAVTKTGVPEYNIIIEYGGKRKKKPNEFDLSTDEKVYSGKNAAYLDFMWYILKNSYFDNKESRLLGRLVKHMKKDFTPKEVGRVIRNLRLPAPRKTAMSPA